MSKKAPEPLSTPVVQQLDFIAGAFDKFQDYYAKTHGHALPAHNFAAAFKELVEFLKSHHLSGSSWKDYDNIFLKHPDLKKKIFGQLKPEQLEKRVALFDATIALIRQEEIQSTPDQVRAPSDPHQKLWDLMEKTAASPDPDNPLHPDTQKAILEYVSVLKAERQAPRHQQAPKGTL